MAAPVFPQRKTSVHPVGLVTERTSCRLHDGHRPTGTFFILEPGQGMLRTTSIAVKAVLLRDYDANNNPDVDTFIEIASMIVDDVKDCITAKGLTASDAKLEKLECLLAAHAYKASDQQAASKKNEGAQVAFAGKTGMYLDGTKYGQLALSLDTSGCLAQIANNIAVADGEWLGRNLNAQTPYSNR